MKTNIKNNSEVTPSNARTRVLIFEKSKLLYSNEIFEKLLAREKALENKGSDKKEAGYMDNK